VADYEGPATVHQGELSVELMCSYVTSRDWTGLGQWHGHLWGFAFPPKITVDMAVLELPDGRRGTIAIDHLDSTPPPTATFRGSGAWP
jgi:hypothetical protein